MPNTPSPPIYDPRKISGMSPALPLFGNEWLEILQEGENRRLQVSELIGPKGDEGKSAYQVAQAQGYPGTKNQWLASLVGPSAYEVALANGFEGTVEEWLESLIGPAGASLYDLAVEEGFVGTLEDFLASNIGPQGKSAYEVALDEGFVGTAAEWLLTLRGADGESGFEDVPVDDNVYHRRNQDWLLSPFRYIEATGTFILDHGQIITYPGPQELVGGDSSAGFFGELTPNQMINGADLATALGLTVGTPVNPDAGWLKFTLDDQILYVAKQCLREDINWQELYLAGAVYGDETVGAFPIGTPTLQNATVLIGGIQYRVRLLRGANANPADPMLPDSNLDPATSHHSEWNRLLYNVSATNPLSQQGANWASFTNEELDLIDRFSWCQESMSENANWRVLRGYNDISHYSGVNYSTVSNGEIGWRPVLIPLV